LTDNYKYLGVTIDNKCNLSTHLKETLNKLRKATSSLYKFSIKEFPILIKYQIWHTYIKPIAEYASEIWIYEPNKFIKKIHIKLI